MPKVSGQREDRLGLVAEHQPGEPPVGRRGETLGKPQVRERRQAQLGHLLDQRAANDFAARRRRLRGR